jgi:hypothetical protein
MIPLEELLPRLLPLVGFDFSLLDPDSHVSIEGDKIVIYYTKNEAVKEFKSRNYTYFFQADNIIFKRKNIVERRLTRQRECQNISQV